MNECRFNKVRLYSKSGKYACAYLPSYRQQGSRVGINQLLFLLNLLSEICTDSTEASM